MRSVIWFPFFWAFLPIITFDNTKKKKSMKRHKHQQSRLRVLKSVQSTWCYRVSYCEGIVLMLMLSDLWSIDVSGFLLWLLSRRIVTVYQRSQNIATNLIFQGTPEGVRDQKRLDWWLWMVVCKLLGVWFFSWWLELVQPAARHGCS